MVVEEPRLDLDVERVLRLVVSQLLCYHLLDLWSQAGVLTHACLTLPLHGLFPLQDRQEQIVAIPASLEVLIRLKVITCGISHWF